MILTLVFFFITYTTTKVLAHFSKKPPIAAAAAPRAESKQILQVTQQITRISSSIEHFNNPSSFATYSKMQRQLMKLNDKLEKLKQTQKKENNSKQHSQGDEDKEYLDEGEETEDTTSIASKQTVTKICAYVALVVVGTFVEIVKVPNQYVFFPFSLLLDGDNYASGATVVLLTKLLV